LLVTVTLNNARNAAKWHLRDRRDVHRQVALPAVDGGHDEGAWLPFVAAGPTPDEAVALAEELEQRIRSLADPLLMQIALKKLEGYANKEIEQGDRRGVGLHRKEHRAEAGNDPAEVGHTWAGIRLSEVGSEGDISQRDGGDVAEDDA
jgi:hypothetical protein